MNRLVLLVGPILLVAGAAGGCAHRRGCESDCAPGYTFGRDGVVDRNGGLFGKRKYCPACEWAGTTCADCLARESRRATCSHCGAPLLAEQMMPAPSGNWQRAPATSMGRMGDRSFHPLNRDWARDEESAGPESPYAPVRAGVTSAVGYR